MPEDKAYFAFTSSCDRTKILPFYFEKFPFLIRCLYNIFLQDVGGYSSFVASVNCLVAVYFTPMSCLNSTSVLLSVTFRGYALIIRIQVTNLFGYKSINTTV